MSPAAFTIVHISNNDAKIATLLTTLATAPKSSNEKKAIRRKLRAMNYRLSVIKRAVATTDATPV